VSAEVAHGLAVVSLAFGAALVTLTCTSQDDGINDMGTGDVVGEDPPTIN
jgi:hypothetical protein